MLPVSSILHEVLLIIITSKKHFSMTYGNTLWNICFKSPAKSTPATNYFVSPWTLKTYVFTAHKGIDFCYLLFVVFLLRSISRGFLYHILHNHKKTDNKTEMHGILPGNNQTYILPCLYLNPSLISYMCHLCVLPPFFEGQRVTNNYIKWFYNLTPPCPRKRMYPLPLPLISQRDLFQMSRDSLYEPKRNFSSPTEVTHITN